jgi:hypothetical protein
MPGTAMSSADGRVNGHAPRAIVERLLAEDSPHLSLYPPINEG